MPNRPTRTTVTALMGALLSLPLSAGESTPAYDEIESPPHNYSKRIPTDRVTALKSELEAGRLSWDVSSERAFLRSLLRQFGIPESSQLLVFSTTSLQLGLISPSNPRAIYFTDDVYVGYIPGGRIEIVSIDPELGGIFYIFDIPRGNEGIRLDRSGRCMNCHASEETGQVPGLVLKSVIPGRTGGSLNAFRIGQTGHQIPYTNRFGGWHVTGSDDFTNHLGNFIGRMMDGQLQRISNPLGERFQTANYLEPTSDLLAHALLEHQAGFVNRTTEAAYRFRTIGYTSKEKPSEAQNQEMRDQARSLARYILFAEEALLPPGKRSIQTRFALDFQRSGIRAGNGHSLRELEFSNRLMRYRCSYMIYSIAFQGLNQEIRNRVYEELRVALAPGSKSELSSHIPAEEKKIIREILQSTIPEFPKVW